MTENSRKKKPQPKRAKYLRNVGAKAAPGGAEPAQPLGEAVSDAVASAVRLGYKVLAQNIEEGRAAAKQFRAGEYSVGQAPADLNLLAVRTLRLARDLSTTTFDILDRLLTDPALVSALQRAAGTPPAKAPAAKPSPKASPDPTSDLVTLTCNLTGRPAQVKTAILTRPGTPAALTVTGLAPANGAAPAITDVTFTAAPDGKGVAAAIAIPANQPPGLYNGILLAADSQLPLGALSVQVLP